MWSVCSQGAGEGLVLRDLGARGCKKHSSSVGHEIYSGLLVVCVAPNTSALRLLACTLGICNICVFEFPPLD